MSRPSRFALIAVLAVGLGSPWAPRGAAASDGTELDPIEPVNRAVFWFNDRVDVYVLEPVATGWDKIAPDAVQRSVANFFANLRFPIVALNNLLQGKFGDTASATGRFAVNTTVGVLGLFDPASGWGLTPYNEDFGQTLGFWGVPAGPYLVLPILGPSNPRDAVGLFADSFASVYPLFVGAEYTLGARGTDTVNARALALEDVRRLKGASLDYYVAIRNAYVQRRKVLVSDQAEMTAEEEEDLYQLEDEESFP